jgi:hypothetical protein
VILKHGKLSVAVPSSWTDQSTLLFTGPVAALPTTRSTKRAQPSLAITFGRATGDARSLLQAELDGLKNAQLGYAPIATTPFSCAFGDGVMSEHRLELDGVKLRQLHTVVVRGDVVVRAVASAGELDYDAVAAELTAALSSIALA